jgi:HEAT repeat protein
MLLPLCLAAPSGAGALEDLREALKVPVDDLRARDQELRRCTANLRTLGELSQALLLPEWRDEEIDPQVAGVDRAVWRSLADRFEGQIRDILRGEDVPRKLGAVGLLGETGEQACALGRRTDLLRGLAAVIVQFMKESDPRFVEASARALGQIHPDPQLALPALKRLLDGDDAGQRLAAAEGLLSLMNGAATRARKGRSNNRAEALRAEAGVVGSLVVPVAARGLGDEQPEVRRACVGTLREAAALANALVGEAHCPQDAEERAIYRQDVELERGALGSLVFTLQVHGPALGRLLTDSDAEVRQSSRRALEALAQARQRLLARAASIETAQPVASPRKQNAAQSMPVAELTAGISDRDVKIRLATLDILEALGPAAAPAAPVVVKALNDPDRFVRWAAARALGKMGAVEAESAVPALTGLLADSDVDLRVAAATALAVYGPSARAAVPALLGALLSDDSGLRVTAMRALERIGFDGPPALPLIRDALEDRNAVVRQNAARLLGKLGPSARDALGSLRLHLKDSSPEVRAAAQEALLSIVR